jgi:hypothetical protein
MESRFHYKAPFEKTNALCQHVERGRRASLILTGRGHYCTYGGTAFAVCHFAALPLCRFAALLAGFRQWPPD